MSKKSKKKPKKAKRVCDEGRLYESTLPARHAPATDALPGSPEKVDELCRRFARRLSLFSPGDLIDREGMRLSLASASGNYARVRDGGIIDCREGPEKNSSAQKLTKNPGPDPGDRLREVREGSGLSLRACAARAGVDHRVWHRLERREHAPTLWVLYRVAKAFSVSLDWLAGLPTGGQGGPPRNVSPALAASEETRRARAKSLRESRGPKRVRTKLARKGQEAPPVGAVGGAGGDAGRDLGVAGGRG